MQQHAKGNRPQACRDLTITEEDQLFQLGLFGKHEPEVLQRTVWWVLSLHFGFRAHDESRRLKWGDIVLSITTPKQAVNCCCGKLNEDPKPDMATGQHQKAFYPTAQATENKRCPVQLYRAFPEHRQLEMKQPDSSFFLAINHRRQPSPQIWYSKAALGKNEIGKFLSKASKAAKLPGNITNHSVRKTCISRLMDADIPENFVAQLSGHKNLKSFDSYKSASTAHQRKISLVLSRSTPPSCATGSKRLQPLETNLTKLSTTMSSKAYPTPAALQSKACFREQQFKRSKPVISTFTSTRARVRSEEQIVPKKDVLSRSMTVNRTKYYLYLNCLMINFPLIFIYLHNFEIRSLELLYFVFVFCNILK